MNRPLNMQGAHGTWRLLAEMHRPTAADALQAEIRRLRDTGLQPRDIADSLRLDLAVVLQALRATA